MFGVGRVERLAGAAVGVVLFVALWASPVAAHTAFESSDPADGDVVVEPLSEVVIRFSGPAEPVGEGFMILLPSGEVVEPDRVSAIDENSWRLILAEPTFDGIVAVRWQVQAPDSHPIEGVFSFTVAAPAPEPEPETPIQETRAASDVSAVPAAPTTSAPIDDLNPDPGETTVALEEFLGESSDDTPSGAGLGFVGRSLGLGGTVLIIGLGVFVAIVLTSADPERVRLLRLMSLGGVVVAAAVVIELEAQVVRLRPDMELPEVDVWRSVLGSSSGAGAALRACGGVVIAAGAWLTGWRLPPVVAAERPRLVSTIAGAGPEDETDVLASDDATVGTSEQTGRLPVTVLLVGVALLLASVVFDGHTATSGQRLITALVDVVHVSAAAVWVGGVTGLAIVLVTRHRNGVALGGLRLGTRFSSVAALALAVAGVAGVTLTITILDGLDELFTTTWGRVLLLKVLLVGVAGSVGAYNHFVVLRSSPAADDGDQAASHRLLRMVTIEATVLLAVIVVTAALIASSSTP